MRYQLFYLIVSIKLQKVITFILPCVAAIGSNSSSVLESASSKAEESNLSPEVDGLGLDLIVKECLLYVCHTPNLLVS